MKMLKSRFPILTLRTLIFLTSSFQVLHHAESYSIGAPDAACVDMTPQHGQTIQTSVPPYTLIPNATSIYGGQRIVLKLEANGDEYLEGFFLQGRESEDGTALGTFFTTEHNTVTCGQGIHNAATHTNNKKRNTVTIDWEAPSDYEGDVLFRATVVKSYVTYWTSLRSEKVTVKKRSATEKPEVTDSTQKGTSSDNKAGPAISLAEAVKSIYNGCGDTKTCYGSPNKCVEKKNCKFMVTYTDAGNGKFEFELKGKGGQSRYVAAALSLDASMGDDSVVVCAANSAGTVDTYMSWNDGKNNINVRNPKLGLEVQEVKNKDGELYCNFLRDQVTRVNNNGFDLKNEKFHVMVAEGSISNDNRIQYHGQTKIVSASPAALGVTSNLKQADTRFYKSLHAILMIFAWVCAASCGILFARYYKQTWLQSKCCNIDQWFHFHRLWMILTWCSTLTALGLIVYDLGEFRPTIHAIIGIVSIALCFIQPFMAALRPPPNGKNRGIFNWLHWFVGNSAQILGITAIFFGLELFLGNNRNWVKEVSWYTLIAFIAFHCIVHLVLSISQCISDRKPKNSEVFPLKELAGSRTLLQPDDVRMDAPHSGFRKFMLAIYLPLNWIAAALLIVLVFFTREQIEDQLTEWNVPAFWEEINTGE